LQGAGRYLLGGPVDPLDLQGIEAPPELDDETAGTLPRAAQPDPARATRRFCTLRSDQLAALWRENRLARFSRRATGA